MFQPVSAELPAANFPVYHRSSSFSSLMSCLTETWGDLPLKEDDSEDMVIYGVLRDAVSDGWTPFNFTAGEVKAEPWESIEAAVTPACAAPTVTAKRRSPEPEASSTSSVSENGSPKRRRKVAAAEQADSDVESRSNPLPAECHANILPIGEQLIVSQLAF
nr:ethylene-responsive transcription factor 2-like [Ipomoea trifida]GMC65764.1 ethylene-responsive transcription factor 2 [Ipomoea batatas]GME16519.1 ethylene-responsive transcription factor 2 [Ipomoea batatas]